MALSLPKISIGVSTERNHFDKVHDVNTTSDFGFCQPTLFDEVPAKTEITLQTHSKVLMGILPQQSFARIEMQSFCNYVPLKSVFLAYEEMMTNQMVTSALSTYMPTEADNLTVNQLLMSIFLGTTAYLNKNFTDYKTKFQHRLFYGQIWDSVYDEVGTTVSPVQYNAENSQEIIHTIFGNASTEIDYKGYSLLSACYDTLNVDVSYKRPDYIDFDFNTSDFKFLVKTFEDSEGTHSIYATFYLTHYGRRLFKILYGLGYDFAKGGDKVSICPLLAYYMTWFDKFNPQRTVQWKVTNAYKLIHGYYDHNHTLGSIIDDTGFSVRPVYYTTHFYAWIDFLMQLPYCCYSLPIDYFTCCTDSPVSGNSESSTFNQVIDHSYSTPAVETATVFSDGYPFHSNTNSSIMLRWMQKLLPRINKNSVIGARVDKLMQAKFGQSLPDNSFFGDDKCSCYIDPILATADTSTATGGSLVGERSGQSSTNHSSRKHKFHCEKEGYIFQLTCIVPYGGYSQGVNPHVSRISQYDFYDRTFDGLGVAPVKDTDIFGVMHDFDMINWNHRLMKSGTFGFRPRLMDYKFKTNLRNGDFRNASSSKSFMGYNSDRFFNEFEYQFNGYEEGVERKEAFEPIVSESLRFIGQSESYGNYDRIFYDTKGITDNFIIQMIQDYHIYSPMLPVSESYDTFDNSGLKDDNSSVKVAHS